MSLSPGKRLGTYDIAAQIGEGGMGQVFRATDVRLKRQVALKVLPPSFANDRDRLARFQREAEVLASLNHPNIAAIYGLEEQDGVSALVMEFVDGPTLADRIANGPMLVSETIAIALQIADALAAAHEQGIVHRDLKPANVKVREDGTVKVLDFGLARAPVPGQDESLPAVSQSPTITSPAMTQAGMLLGTAAYMSPEQAKGKVADKRSDIWAFGCVLYEMLTGRRPFRGEDISDTLAAVLKDEPDWSALPAGLSPIVRSLLQQALVKDRHRRVADIAVASFALRQIGAEAREAPRTAPRVRSVAPWTLVGLALIAAVAGLASLRRPAPSAALLVRFSLPILAESSGQFSRQVMAVSPDGTQIAIALNNKLYVRRLDDLQVRPIDGAEPSSSIVFSPNGDSVAYYTLSDRKLRRMALSGGVPTVIAELPMSPFGVGWSERGIVWSLLDQGIFLLPTGSVTPQLLVAAKADESFWGPQILPGGRDVLFTVAKGRDLPLVAWDAASIVVQSIDTGERKTVLEGGSDGRYLPSGHLLYSRVGSVYAVAFDVKSATARGEPVVVLEGVRRSTATGTGASTYYAVSQSGVMVYVSGPAQVNSNQRTILIADRDGSLQPLKLPAALYDHPRASPDGTRIAVELTSGSQSDIWIYDLDGRSALRRLTLDGRSHSPVWSHDGKKVTFRADDDIYWQDADGLSVRERLVQASSGARLVPESWSPDGATLLFREERQDGVVLMMRSTTDDKPKPFGSARSLQLTGATFSPDGRWVAYTETHVTGGQPSPDRGVYVEPFPPTGARFQVPKANVDFHPVWSRTKNQIIYVPVIGRPLAVVDVQFRPQPIFSAPTRLPNALQTFLISTEARGYDTMPDERFVLLAREGDLSMMTEIPELRVVLNWQSELMRLLPSR